MSAWELGLSNLHLTPAARGGRRTSPPVDARPAPASPAPSASGAPGDTATQPAGAEATPPADASAGQCSTPFRSSTGSYDYFKPECKERRYWPLDAKRLLCRRCGFAVDEEGLLGIGDGVHVVKLNALDLAALEDFITRARPLLERLNPGDTP